MTLDSEYKARLGGRGVGRLLWLKAFRRATVESVNEADNVTRNRRSFSFDSHQGVSDPDVVVAVESERLTVVHLSGLLNYTARHRQRRQRNRKESLGALPLVFRVAGRWTENGNYG